MEPIVTRTGFLTCVSITRATEASMVAEKHNVWRGAGILDQRFEQWEDKGKSLAGSGLRRGDDIVAGKRGRNCFGLYGGRLDETMPREIGLQNRGQRDFSKCVHSKVCEGDQRAD